MSIPKILIQWSTYCHLDDHKDAQLILLKGHLLLEIFLSGAINDKQLSFFGKINKFESLFNSSFITNALLELNKMRNELAHTWNFSAEESGLYEWSDRILNNIEYEAEFRRTPRTKIVHAIAALAGEIYKHGKTAEPA